MKADVFDKKHMVIVKLKRELAHSEKMLDGIINGIAELNVKYNNHKGSCDETVKGTIEGDLSKTLMNHYKKKVSVLKKELNKIIKDL